MGSNIKPKKKETESELVKKLKPIKIVKTGSQKSPEKDKKAEKPKEEAKSEGKKAPLPEFNQNEDFGDQEIWDSRGRTGPIMLNFHQPLPLEMAAAEFITPGDIEEKEDISYSSKNYVGSDSYSTNSSYESKKGYSPGADQNQGPMMAQKPNEDVINPFNANAGRNSNGYGKSSAGRLEGYAMTEAEKKEANKRLPHER